MFARMPNGTSDETTPERTSSANQFRQPRMPLALTDGPTSRSVIGKDLRIVGQSLKIISQGTIQVEGEVEGDVTGNEIVVSNGGKVTGTVVAERVIVRGTVSGVIRGLTVALQAAAKVEGDVHHVSLTIEQGAEFEGRCKRLNDPSQLTLAPDKATVLPNTIPLARPL